MNKKIIKGIVAVLAISTVVLTAGCAKNKGTSGGTGSDGKKKIVVATSADYPPYEFHANINDKDTIVGFDIDIAKEIAKDMNADLEIRDMDFDGLLAALSTGKADMVIAGMTPTPERQKNASFSKIYYNATHGIVMKKDEASSVASLNDLNGKVVGVQSGSIQADMADKQIQNAKEIKKVSKITDLVLMLQSGKVDAIIMEKPVADSYIKSNDNLALAPLEIKDTTGGSAIAFKLGNTEMVNQANSTIDRLLKAGKIDEYLTDANKLADEQKGK